jgi:hypothetical protein
MKCAGVIAADGGASVKVWPAGGAEPAKRSANEGLTLFLEPACASCKAENACPFFTAFAQEQGFPCQSAVPAGEQTSKPQANIILFQDPPGLAGSGWPSGGDYAANGVVGITTNGEVFRSTCTLPSSEHSLCTTSLNYVITRYSTSSAKETPKPESKEQPPTNEPKEEGKDEVGSSSHTGDTKFCEEQACISSFTTESGTVVECSDETFSHAGGIQGACSRHGGVKRE